MKNTRFLNIKGVVLDRENLKKFIEKTAANYEIKKYSNTNTYPIERIDENYLFIEKTYNLLNEHIKKNIEIHPAGEWLLDNFYIIEETVKKIKKEMPLKKYKQLPGIANGIYEGFARIYLIASEIASYTDNKIDDEILKIALMSYQKQRNLNMEEIWNLWIFLEIAIIENIRSVCEKIYTAQIQKYKVEAIIERLVEKKEELKFKSPKISFKPNYLKNEMKYPFIEYMSYKLKRYGKKGIPYLNILEEEVKKTGITISEAIQKEHYDIAMQKVLIGNSITSIKEISRINFLVLFEEINGVEEILKKDPANEYSKMEYKTKAYYREKIKELANKTKISENYIVNKVLEIVNENLEDEKKSHIGYYLIDDGYNELIKRLNANPKLMNKTNKTKVNTYISTIYLLTTIFTIICGLSVYKNTQNLIYSIIIFILTYIPISEILTQIINYILVKTVKPKTIPKLDFSAGIPEEYSTIVVIPTIINSKKKVEELMHKLEVYYLANKSENLYFALLGDCTSSNNEKEDFDGDVIKTGIYEADKLNDKYGNKFYFLYRNRIWNASEKCYLGWERKRGLLSQFNEFLITGENVFNTNTLIESDIKNKIKYVITLDSDTNLVFDSANQLIGAMAHILNKPKINEKTNIVEDGHALLQPRVGIDLESSRQSLFSKIFSGMGGTDLYANAISDVYQDNFGEGIFTGKGIYDVKVFHKVLSNEMPENTVLSHDLLEGSYLRAGLDTSIFLLDGCPGKYNSYIERLHRWIRGDWQLLGWLQKVIVTKNGTKKQNPLNTLSKFKILDNLRRSLVPVFALILIIIGLAFKSQISFIIGIISIIFPSILDLGNYIIFKKSTPNSLFVAHKSITKIIGNLQASVLRGLLDFLFLPDKAFKTINAVAKSIYRLKISKQNLLEWTTSEEAEKKAKTDLYSYFKNMRANVILGIMGLLVGIYFEKTITLIIGAIWLIAPYFAWYISKKNVYVQNIGEKDKNYLVEIGNKTWKYFEDNINEYNNFLPPDNYQESRRQKIANRTSPTNIGLGLLAIVSACDLGYIDEEKCINLIEKMLFTIEKLPKWCGHLYNWYNTVTLEPLMPRYISTVDSGNFVGYLYTLKSFLKDIAKTEKIDVLIQIIDRLITNTNFLVLYDYKKRIFSIGFNIEENKLTDSYYDLLASEARQASLVAIAKRDVPSKHWNSLSRTLTTLNGYKGLISWSGTAFEYLMPSVNIKSYEGSLLDESCRFLIMSQKEYAKKLGVPWGISEAAFNLKDLNNNYQYKAFGIPWLGLKRGLDEDAVISSYSVFLSLIYDLNGSIKNIKRLEQEGMVGKYGFYESVDYTSSRLKPNETKQIVKTYMAHHQGLILLSINNCINNKILINRFYQNPEIEAIDILLQERMPQKAIVTKEKKEKIEKLKTKDYQSYSERIYTNVNKDLLASNVISNGTYTVVSLADGQGFSKYKNIMINKFKETDDYKQGNFFYIKNLSNNKIISANIEKNDEGKISFSPDCTKSMKIVGNLKIKTSNVIAPDEPVEIRRLEIINEGDKTENLEVINYFEPTLSSKEQEYSHPAFNNLFVTYEQQETGEIIVKRKKRGFKEKDIFLGVNLFTENQTIGNLEFEINKEKFFGQGNFSGIPETILENKPFSNELSQVTESVLATKKIIKLEAKSKAIVDLVLCVSENKDNVINMLDIYKNTNAITKTFELSRAKTEAETIYLGLKGKDIEKYQKMLSLLLFHNPIKYLQTNIIPNQVYSQGDLWKFGISGDLPILLVKIKDINEKYILKDVLKAYDFFRSKNIKIELVILNREINSYEHYLESEIDGEIQNKQLLYLKNIFGGIFTINENELKKEDLDLLEFRANLILDASLGNIETQLKDLEEEYLTKRKSYKQIKEINTNDNIETLNKDYSILKYYNEYGGFTEDGQEYEFKVSDNQKLPTVWSTILSNPEFGTLVTQNLGGFTWYKNSRLNRITAWNNTPSRDIPSEIIYLENLDNGKKWSLSENISNFQEYHLTYGFGYVKLKTLKDEILHELNIFVPLESTIKINILKLKNTSNKKKNLKIVYYIKPVLGEDEIKTSGYIKVEQRGNFVIATNMYKHEMKNEQVFVTTNKKINEFTGDKTEFIGNMDLKNPEKSLGNKNGLYKKSCIAIEIDVSLEAYETQEILLNLGAKNEEEALNEDYTNIEKCEELLKNTRNYWYELLNRVHVNTPIESINIMLNGWSVYQSIVSRLWAKSGYYQSGGAIGFRDQLQDTLGVKYVDINLMKKQILIAAKHQFIEGDVEHWWHEETRKRYKNKVLR